MGEVKVSLKNRIKAAKTVQEVETLLSEGKTYKTANKNTKGKWQRIAAARVKALNV